MSDQFRKFNQASSQVSVAELLELDLIADLPNPTRRDAVKTASAVIASMPDLSEPNSPAQAPSCPSLSRSESSQNRRWRDHLPQQPVAAQSRPATRGEPLDAVIGELSAAINDNVAERAYELRSTRTSVPDHPASAYARQQRPTVPLENVRQGPVSSAAEAPSHHSTTSVPSLSARSEGLPTACLSAAVATIFAENDPKLLGRLVKRREKLGSQIILLADVEQPDRGMSICVQMALDIAANQNLQVLVVDGDVEEQRLTHTAIPRSISGWRECLWGESTLDKQVVPSERRNVFFLSPGLRNVNLRHVDWQDSQDASRLQLELRERFDLIFVALGTAFTSSLTAWGKISDLCFLTLNPLTTSRSLARLAVQELQQNGARIEGCITSHTETARPSHSG